MAETPTPAIKVSLLLLLLLLLHKDEVTGVSYPISLSCKISFVIDGSGLMASSFQALFDQFLDPIIQ